MLVLIPSSWSETELVLSITAMPPSLLLLLLLVTAGPLLGSPGRWDHHSRARSTAPAPARTTPRPAPRPARPAWRHRLGWSVPPGRCQARGLAPVAAKLDQNYIDYVSELLVEDKAILAPVVFEGAMVSRTNTHNHLYWVSFKVFRVVKGAIHQQLRANLRLLFQTESGLAGQAGQRRRAARPGKCAPVPFNVR